MNLMKKEQREDQLESKKGNVYRSPACDILENDNEYIVYFDVPGVEKSDLNIKVEKNNLYLTAECAKNPGENYLCLRDEMIYSGFRRSFDLGESVDSEKISAEYANGTLKPVLPKKEEEKNQEIKIKVG